MMIDARVEPLVREALAAVITKDRGRFQQAIDAFPDDAAMTQGVQLAATVAMYIVEECYGRSPTKEQIRETADDIATVDDWTDIVADEVATFIVAAVDHVRFETVLPIERFVLLSYVMAGYLLSFHRRENEEWWDHLDRAEAVIEARPNQ